jgi:nucleoside-diphosphate-sugar epimerase
MKLEPQYAAKRPGDIIQSLAGVDKARVLLGFACEVSFKAGLELTFEWYRKSQKSK